MDKSKAHTQQYITCLKCGSSRFICHNCPLDKNGEKTHHKGSDVTRNNANGTCEECIECKKVNK